MRHRWQDEYKKLKVLSEKQIKLLEEGPKQLTAVSYTHLRAHET